MSSTLEAIQMAQAWRDQPRFIDITRAPPMARRAPVHSAIHSASVETRILANQCDEEAKRVRSMVVAALVVAVRKPWHAIGRGFQGSGIANASCLRSSTTGRCRFRMGVSPAEGLEGVTTGRGVLLERVTAQRARLGSRGVYM